MSLIFLLLTSTVSGLDFFVLTDLHFDREYSGFATADSACHEVGLRRREEARIGQFGCDSPIDLIQAALREMKSVNPDPDFVVVAGDMLGHSMQEQISKDGKEVFFDSLKLVATTLKAEFPSTQMLLALGNNDLYEDYVVPQEEPVENSLNRFLSDLWTPLTGALPASFLAGGYYTLPTRTGHKAIVLNSNYFSIQGNHQFQTATKQLNWLERELESAEPASVLLIMHIPPGPGMYGGNSYDWHSCYIDRFVSILTKQQRAVLLILAGHQHKAGLQIIPKTRIGIMVHSALSPVYRNNPGFRHYELTPETQDYTDFYLNLSSPDPIWTPLFVFSEFFPHLKKFDFEEMYGSFLRSDADVLTEYISKGHGLDPGLIGQAELWQLAVGMDETVARRVALCAYKFISNFDFELCKWGIHAVS